MVHSPVVVGIDVVPPVEALPPVAFGFVVDPLPPTGFAFVEVDLPPVFAFVVDDLPPLVSNVVFVVMDAMPPVARELELAELPPTAIREDVVAPLSRPPTEPVPVTAVAPPWGFPLLDERVDGLVPPTAALDRVLEGRAPNAGELSESALPCVPPPDET